MTIPYSHILIFSPQKECKGYASTHHAGTENPPYVHVGGGVGVFGCWGFWGVVGCVWWFSPRAVVLYSVRLCYLSYGYGLGTTGVDGGGGAGLWIRLLSKMTAGIGMYVLCMVLI